LKVDGIASPLPSIVGLARPLLGALGFARRRVVLIFRDGLHWRNQRPFRLTARFQRRSHWAMLYQRGGPHNSVRISLHVTPKSNMVAFTVATRNGWKNDPHHHSAHQVGV
jgi:hypothetical protein